MTELLHYNGLNEALDSLEAYGMDIIGEDEEEVFVEFIKLKKYKHLNYEEKKLV